MDDGSSKFTSDQRPRAHLATNGFTWGEAELLCEMLVTRFNVACDVFDYKGPTIVLTADGTEQFFDIIHPYIPASMKYKISEKYRSRPCVLEGEGALPQHTGILPSEVISVEHENVAVHESPDLQYDLTVADNHNYFAGGILVHNSNVGVVKLDSKIYPVQRLGFLASTSPYLQHSLFVEWVFFHQERFLEVLGEGERLCGEWLIQAHSTRYALPHEPFVAFDIMSGNCTRLNFEEFDKRVGGLFVMPRLIQMGDPLSVESAIEAISTSGHGAIDPVEGAIWRVERFNKIDKKKGKDRHWVVDFLTKYVRPEKEDGIFLPGIGENLEPIWNTFEGDDWLADKIQQSGANYVSS
jgi:hypothetical protein